MLEVFIQSAAARNLSLYLGLADTTNVGCGSRPPEKPASLLFHADSTSVLATCSGSFFTVRNRSTAWFLSASSLCIVIFI